VDQWHLRLLQQHGQLLLRNVLLAVPGLLQRREARGEWHPLLSARVRAALHPRLHAPQQDKREVRHRGKHDGGCWLFILLHLLRQCSDCQ